MLYVASGSTRLLRSTALFHFWKGFPATVAGVTVYPVLQTGRPFHSTRYRTSLRSRLRIACEVQQRFVLTTDLLM